MKNGQDLFPVVLHRVLMQLELASGGTEIASFLADGKSFKIKNQFMFEKHVLPVFFPKMNNFASFQRQLNFYDFKRIDGPRVDRGGYYHALFERKAPALVTLMRRRKVKGEGCTPSRELLNCASRPNST